MLPTCQLQREQQFLRQGNVSVENYFIFSFICPDGYFLIIINIMKPTRWINRVAPKFDKEKKGYKQTQMYSKIEPDIYIISQSNVYPLHKEQAMRSAYISRNIKEGEKVIILALQIENQQLELALNFLYGCQLKLERSSSFQNLYLTAKHLEIADLVAKIEEDFRINFDQYSFFDLYKIAVQHDIKWLLKRCQQQLHALQYEQININKSDLLALPRSIFESVIRNHQKMKANKLIVGLTRNQIKDAIEAYSEHNDLSMSSQRLMEIGFNDFQIEGSNQMTLKPKILKSQGLMLKTSSIRSKAKSVQNKSCIEFQSMTPDQIVEQVLQLAEINQDMEKRSEFLNEQLKQLKDQLQVNQSLDLDEIQKKMKVYSDLYSSQKTQDAPVIVKKDQLLKLSSQEDDGTFYGEMSIDDHEKDQALCQKIGISLQTTSPSQSQNVISGSFSRMPKMERDINL